MPHSELHKTKLKKNLAVGAMVLLWCALIWAVTMIKIARAQEGVNYHIYHNNGKTYRGRTYSGIGIERAPVDTKGPMHDERHEFMNKSELTREQWNKEFHNNADQRHSETEKLEEARKNRLDAIVTTQDGWTERWLDNIETRLEKEHERDTKRMERLDIIESKQMKWWDNWAARREKKNERSAP